jgi:hypothetical protein
MLGISVNDSQGFLRMIDRPGAIGPGQGDGAV